MDSNSGSDVNGNSVSLYRWETPDKHVIKIHISLSIEEAVNMFKKIRCHSENAYILTEGSKSNLQWN